MPGHRVLCIALLLVAAVAADERKKMVRKEGPGNHTLLAAVNAHGDLDLEIGKAEENVKEQEEKQNEDARVKNHVKSQYTLPDGDSDDDDDDSGDDDNEWSKFVVKTGKMFKNKEEHFKRKENFKKNINRMRSERAKERKSQNGNVLKVQAKKQTNKQAS